MRSTRDIVFTEFITLQCTQLEVSVSELSLCVLSVKYGLHENCRSK